MLTSPLAVETGEDDWRRWYAGAVHTGLDQVGSSAQVGQWPTGCIHYLPTVWDHASTCGELVTTTHTAFWEQEDARSRPDGLGPRAAGRMLGSTID